MRAPKGIWRKSWETACFTCLPMMLIVVFVDCAGEDNAYVDMALMSCCRHHILANSSFSWWGAWLNPRQDKIVAAPDKWLNTSEGTDVYYGLCTVRINGEGEVTREGL